MDQEMIDNITRYLIGVLVGIIICSLFFLNIYREKKEHIPNWYQEKIMSYVAPEIKQQ